MNFPCKDCITLPICKSFVKTNHYKPSIKYLTRKCSLIDIYLASFTDEYITRNEDGFKRYKSRDEVFKFLGGVSR